MTRRLVLFCFMASFLEANVDQSAVPNLPSSTSEFLGDAELIAGLDLSETNESVLPLPLEADPSGVDKFDLSETIGEDTQPDGPVFLLSVIGLPRPAEAEMSLVQSATFYTPPQDPFNIWLLLGVGSMAIALIGAARALHFRRSSAHRA